jgi:hypothetical protein
VFACISSLSILVVGRSEDIAHTEEPASWQSAILASNFAQEFVLHFRRTRQPWKAAKKFKIPDLWMGNPNVGQVPSPGSTTFY